jgi:hypothetical protein
MSIDSRLRQGLERSARGGTPDLVDDLPDALARGRRRKRVMIAVRVTSIATVVAIVAVVGPRLVSSLRTEQPAVPAPTPPIGTTDFSAIAGTYTVELTNADSTVAANHMAGTWTIQLGSDGAMQLSLPAGFTREGQTPAGNVFTLAASQFRTNLFYNDFCHSVAVYRWQLRGTRLTFTPLSEDCAVRRAVFASHPWDVQG